ncbi:putative phosphodiesterase [Limnobacter thiooxidans]|uniref:Metallophosphoesterase family protein n=1 Tax=Limnobacter thiooxidans TaxID=131080 RepID=A0AA86IZQ0_9BURK|nr:putative phosphodiesterase [Limnobacter thiooxidans]BET25088.1 metallophosphoesterase family protein [Limnobacter thiooxidans]
MKIALLSDVHSNLQALKACTEHARKAGAQQFVILGDLVGYGGDPAGVVDEVMALWEQGAWVVKGNHDDMAVNPPPALNDMGSSSAAWTHARLSLEQREFLATRPMTKLHGKALFVHASANQPAKWEYVDSEHKAKLCMDAACRDHSASHVFLGHVHHQVLYYPGASRNMMRFDPVAGVAIPTPLRRQMVVTVGSVGQPRDGDVRSMYAMYDDVLQTLSFYRVAYDAQSAAQAIRKAGLPEQMATRLELGR